MTILNLQDEVRTKAAQGNFGQDMLCTVFQRTSCLLSLLHAKKLLQVHGFESFNDYIGQYFDTNNPKKKNAAFVKLLKETPEYKEFSAYQEESRNVKNHPKLKKLAEILIAFFQDPEHSASSKVIVFS